MKKVLYVLLSVCLLTACGKEASQFAKAERLTRQGKFEKAIQLYSGILNKNPENAAAYANRGLLYERLKVKDRAELTKNKRLAERDYLRATELDYYQPEVFNNLGALYIDLRRYDDAVVALNQALLLQPNYFLALVNRGVAQSQLGRLSSALSDFARADQIRPNDPLLYLNRGLAEFAAGYYATAVNDYTDLMELEPENPRPYLERGRAFVKMGYYQNAVDDFQHAIALRPTYALPYYYIAELLYSRAETDEAVAYAEHAKELAPNYAPVYDMLGDMYALSSPVDATRHYLAARRLDPARRAFYEQKIRMMNSEKGRRRIVSDRFLNLSK